jgi:hypothetical protein
VVRRAARFLALTLILAACGGAAQGRGAARACPQPAPDAAASARALDALRARRDVWGDALLARPGGPTLAAASRYLRPLLYARAAGGTALTSSGVHYLAFGAPAGAAGTSEVALHLADGSQIVSRRIGGASLTVSVGDGGRERYGSCLARLAPAHLADGWLPVLETGYADANGARYRQESFAARVAGVAPLVSFVRVAVDARRARSAVTVRLTASPGARRQLLGPASVRVPPATTRTIYAAWLLRPAPAGGLVPDEESYAAARASVAGYWRGRLASSTTIQVPEPAVEDADRALLVQGLVQTWRYSVGNPYEEFSFPESVDVAQVLAESGFPDVSRAILRTSFGRRPVPYPNWKMGERLLASAEQVRLYDDRAFLAAATPVLRRYVAVLGRQIERDPRGLLGAERYSSDIPDSVLGLHSQTVVWAGLAAMGRAWAGAGETALAATCRRLAARLESGLRRAVRESETRLPDGSLFVPVSLLGNEKPYGSLTEARLGSYWNLVMPYALASGFFAPGGAQARGIERYVELHGGRLLGLVRAGAYALYGRDAAFPTGGTDQVYGINTARFLADEDEPDRLVLQLYGTLAAALTPGTFVAGEAASVAPLAGLRDRAMYLPPNVAAAAAFLETLRLTLVQETHDGAGRPIGVRLAAATPRGWLRPGARVAVANAPTSFGPVSFSITSGARSAQVTVEAPARATPRSLVLRLRPPGDLRIAGVEADGRPYARFDARTGEIDLTGRHGTIALSVVYRRGPA